MSLSPPIYDSPADRQLAELNALRRSPVRSGVMSPARLKLQLLYEQSFQEPIKKGTLRPADPAGGAFEKGKPRLLLMGQRRYVNLRKVDDAIQKKKGVVLLIGAHLIGAESHLFPVWFSTSLRLMRRYSSSQPRGYKKTPCRESFSSFVFSTSDCFPN